MPIITFWSNNEKTIGQTVSASALATVMAIEHNYKVLLISADFNNDSIENCFGIQNSNKEIVKLLVQTPQINFDSGINGLLKMTQNNRISPEVIHDYTKIIFKNRLEVLYSIKNVTGVQEEIEIMGKVKDIILNASRYYDYVIVDLKKGIKYNEQLEILKLSNVVVVNVEQKVKPIQDFLKIKEIQPILPKVVWNICKYDKMSKYNLKNLSRNILKRQTICQTDYNTLLLDATQEGNIAELLIRFKTLREDDENLEFFLNVKKQIETIMMKCHETQMKI